MARRRAAAPGAVAVLGVVVALLAACTAASPFEARSSRTDDLRLAVAADPASVRVRVEMFNGRIQVRAGAPGVVAATVTTTGVGPTTADAEADRAKIAVTLDAAADGTVVLAAVYGPDPGSPRNRTASAIVEVPAGVALVLRTSNAPVVVADVDGPVDARTSNGPVTVADAPDGATVRTSNGTIEVAGGGILDLETSNGRITVYGTAATVVARTSNADLTFEGTLSAGPQEFRASNAPITLRLPADAAFELDAATSNAAVTLDGFEIRVSEPTDRDELRGAVGSGGPAITLRTSNAAIVVSAE